MKNTKRSMLITTVLMVVVLVVAISTSTFAWYTASTSGSATSAVLKSAESGDANIAVGWDSSSTGNTIVFSDTEQSLAPMCPTAELVADAAGITFNSAPIDLTGAFGTVTSPNPWQIKNAQVGEEGDAGYIAKDSKSSFFVINHNINSGVNVKMTAEFTGDNTDKLLVAVFVNDKLQKVITGMASYVVGEIGEGKVENMSGLTNSTELITSGSNGLTFSLDAKDGTNNNFAKITIMAWLDGTALTSADAGKTTGFSFSFNTVA